ncbi:10 kDa chaperonin 1, chloroplastic-like isoform X1 [Andrographis paniculata]|uniref:10 kDa chaperonin 1, chloroplastic-like isoform X1 n=1 Tax=Andrographis paniculata TaxID=175694 RepID=UPI0021E87CBA|nr:10 kDa chaperonin 1, chloroplastic-like isoform X1 [Andrographis paniculata]
MASSFVALSSCSSFSRINFPARSTNSPAVSSRLNLWWLTGFKRICLKVNAIAKYEPTKVVPQADRVLIRLEALPEKSAGGVLLPKSAVKFERYLMGEVLSTGEDVKNVQTGKKVLFNDISAYEVDLGTDDRHCFCKAGDLLAVVE